jgi:biotin transport system substrate-specific component
MTEMVTAVRTRGRPAPTLIPHVDVLTDVLFVIAGTALVAGAAQISITLGSTPVPITGQTFAVLLVGAALGTARGFASLLLYLVVGIAGAPVYADHHHGWSQVTSASGGYLVGFVIAAAVTGFLAERRWDRRFSSSISLMLTGNVIIYGVGLPWLAVVLNTSNLEETLEYGLYYFVPGDIIKLYLAAALLPTAWKVARRPDA